MKEFLWDDLNRLTKIKVDSNDEAIFIYDVNNQRVRKEYDSDDDGDIDGNDETIEYVWSDAHVIEEYVDGSLDRNYVHGNSFIDELVLFEDSSGDYHYYLQDFRYTVYALVDDTGTVEERYRFDPYGKRTVVTDDGSIDEHYGFTGRYHDDSDETDLIYFRNRWMSPEMGRFVSRDPFEYEYIDGMNLYAGWFVVLMFDPYGENSVTKEEEKKANKDQFKHYGDVIPDIDIPPDPKDPKIRKYYIYRIRGPFEINVTVQKAKDCECIPELGWIMFISEYKCKQKVKVKLQGEVTEKWSEKVELWKIIEKAKPTRKIEISEFIGKPYDCKFIRIIIRKCKKKIGVA